MGLADSRPEPAFGYGFPPTPGLRPVPPGLPGSSTNLSLRAVPFHPGRLLGCMCLLLPRGSLASPSQAGWPPPLCVTRPIRVHAYGITARRFAARGFVTGITPDHARLATCRTGNLHGELLSVHKIRQAYPGTPEDAEEPLRIQDNRRDAEAPSRTRNLGGRVSGARLLVVRGGRTPRNA